MPVMNATVSRAKMPVRLYSQVKTMPAPQIEGRNVRKETTSDALRISLSSVGGHHERMPHSHKRRDRDAA